MRMLHSMFLQIQTICVGAFFTPMQRLWHTKKLAIKLDTNISGQLAQVSEKYQLNLCYNFGGI